MSLRLKVFGLERTGTNWTEVSALRMFPGLDILGDRLGSKHAPIAFNPDEHPDVRCAVCIKRPRAWLTSFAKWKRTKHEIIWPRNKAELEYDIARWNTNYRNWLGLIEAGIGVGLLYRTALEDHGHLGRVLSHLLNRTAVGTPEPRVVREARRITDQPFDAEYYRLERFREAEVQRHWQAAERLFDWELMARYGIERAPLAQEA